MKEQATVAMILSLILIGGILGASADSFYALSAFSVWQYSAEHEYYNDPPPYWKIISAREYDLEEFSSYQVALSGDYLGTGEIVTITCLHHGQPGIFLHRKVGSSYQKEVLYPNFDPESEDSWPVKGMTSGDIDADGYPEIVTGMDLVYDPSNHPSTEPQKPFPGAIYMDTDDESEPQPLVWGAWGENLAHPAFTCSNPYMIAPEFRSPENPLPDIAVPMMSKINGKNGLRVIVLEQPEEGFDAYNYTYVTKTQRGTPPYEQEPFYVKHLYVDRSGMIAELYWTQDEVEGASCVWAGTLVPLNINNDDLMDMAVGRAYMDSEIRTIYGRVTLYERIQSSEYTYLFKQNETFTIPYGYVEFGEAANLDGDNSNGKESLVFYLRYEGSIRSIPTGFVSIKNIDGHFRMEYIHVTSIEEYPYSSGISRLVILDADKDGYDDVVTVVCEVVNAELAYGDVVLFMNTGNHSGYSFSYEEGHFLVLMDNQGLTWGISAVQLDHDNDPEISVCNGVKLPYWDPLTLGYKCAFGMDVVEYIDARNRWIQVGVETRIDHQQNFLYGDFTDKPDVEIITCYSHSNTGIFHSYQENGEWKSLPVHTRFQPPLFWEEFDGGLVNWTFQPSTGPGAWKRDLNASEHGPGRAYSGKYSLFFDSYGYLSGISGSLISPTFDLTEVYEPAARVCWWNYNGTDHIEVYASTDGGSSFPYHIATLTNTMYPDRWQWSTLDLSDYGDATNLRIKLTCTATGDKTNPHVDGFAIIPAPSYTWPVKGLVGADLDNDGKEEFVTAMDEVFYPPNHPNSSNYKPFPGVVYCDWYNGSFAEPQPLVWGAWGEQLCSTTFSNCIPVVTEPRFRNDTSDKWDILVPTSYDETDSTVGARVFLLEQPEQGWRGFNYTFTKPEEIGTEPYITPAFYVKTLWVNTGSMDEELAWHANDVAGCSSAVILGVCQVDQDLAVVGGYRNETRSDPLIEGRIVLYKRLNPALGHEYRFEKTLDLTMEKVFFRKVARADLDGDPLNGKESFVVTYDAYETSNPLGDGGFICLEPDQTSGYRIAEIQISEGTIYPYGGTYSSLVVTDRNSDGFDDVICYFVYGADVQRGDIACFKNRGSPASQGSRFSYGDGFFEVLWPDDSFEWDLKMADADGDGIQELATGLVRRDPPWAGENGTYKLFYRNVLEETQHDVAVTDLITCKQGCTPMCTVCRGFTAHVNVTVVNEGTFNESYFDVYVEASGTLVGTHTVNSLPVDSQIVLTFIWNTSGYTIGNYTLRATADPVPEETDLTDNTFADGMIMVTMVGDLNGDKKVDMKDIGTAAKAFGSYPGHVRWNSNSDINDDGKVDMKDIGIIAKEFGKTA